MNEIEQYNRLLLTKKEGNGIEKKRSNRFFQFQIGRNKAQKIVNDKNRNTDIINPNKHGI